MASVLVVGSRPIARHRRGARKPGGVTGAVIGQLLIAIIGVAELFELYSRNILVEECWAPTVPLFALMLSGLIGWSSARSEHHDGSR
jgi:hypothetical protein